MRTRLLLTAAIAVTALAAAGAAFAAGPPRIKAGLHYAFLGTLTATPANDTVSVTVVGGNRAALRALLGQPATQTFAYGSRTEFLSWASGVPTVVQAGSLAAGDYVRINVRAAAGASLADIEQTAASLVGDHGTRLSTPTQPLYTVRGKLTAVGDGVVTLDVTGGNRRAMRLLIGQGSSQTFTTGGGTIFLLWQGRMPSVIDASKLTVGDRVVVHVRAAKGSSLTQVESTAATKVGDREPASSGG